MMAAIAMLLRNLSDVSGINGFTRYFDQTRSDYLYKRTQFLAALLVFFQPLWLLVDHYLLSESVFDELIALRLGSALFGLILFFVSWGRNQVAVSRIRIFLFILSLIVFQYLSVCVLIEQGYSADTAGYHFFPFMIISLVAIFPLSIIEAAFYAFIVISAEILFQFMSGTFGDVASIEALWLLTVLGLIAIWAGVNQLNMLMFLYRQAAYDPLTMLCNRRQALRYLNNEIENCRQHGKTMSVLFFDLDKFKRFNDTYGHAAGDQVLIAFARVLKVHTRPQQDLASRYGGEEFLCALSGLNLFEAQEVAEQIRQACHAKTVKVDGFSLSFAVSIGVAEINANDDLDSLLNRADQALYKAKEQGRDQVVLAS